MNTNKNRLPYILLFIFIIGFILIAVKGLMVPQPGDENVYYYMGKLVSEGKVPYRDFFYAHPPLHIYLISAVYRIFGFNIVILKSIPLISAILSSIFVFCITKNKYGSPEAIAASLLYLFSYSVMFNSVFSFGIDVAVMLMLAGIFFLWNRNSPIAAGVFFGLAGITRLLVIVPIIIIFASALLSDKKNLFKALCGFLIIFLPVNLIFSSLGGDYITQAYKFHFLKSSEGGKNLREYADIIKLNWILFLSAIPFFFLKEKKRIGIFAIISAVYLLFLMLLKKIFGFYFLAAFPFLAITGGFCIVNLIRELSLKKRAAVLAYAMLVLLFSWNLASDTRFIEKFGFMGFERGNSMSDFIKSKSGSKTILFGDDSAAPLLALMSGSRIAFDFVDTNEQVFISGIKNLKDYLSSLKGKDIIFIIRSRQGISSFPETREFLNSNCELSGSFHDTQEGDYIFYRCG